MQRRERQGVAISEDEIQAYAPEPWRVSLYEKLAIGKLWKPGFGNFRLNLNARALERNYADQALHLSDQHFQTLWLLARARLTGAPINSYEITNFIYESRPDKDIDLVDRIENAVSVEMSALRGLLGVFSGDTVFVQNETGIGYKLVLSGEGPIKKYRGSSSARSHARIVNFPHRRQ
ncbi:hypothetical protein K2P56_00970 [Patescibacteria group bacterium]|nr:hypothetical protein [Patescibacteria group bacterium]